MPWYAWVVDWRLKITRATSDTYREFFEHFADALLIIENGRFVDCNRATVEMLRYSSREEVLQTHPSELSPPTQPDGRESREKADEMIAIAFANGSHRFHWDHQRCDGEVFPVEVLLTAMELDNRKILQVNWRDISDKKKLEEQLRHAQKMEAVGVLAGGIAHDFNNLLVSILGHSELIEMSVGDRPDLLEYVAEIQRAGDRAGALIRQLLAFSRKQEIELKTVDLNEVVRELVRMIERLIGENFELSVTACETPLIVKIDAGQMEQVIVNLVTNARDAMPFGGTIKLSLAECSADQCSAGLDCREESGQGSFASLVVQDFGDGMESATVDHAFDPFFTTKAPGKGTGLGLSTVYGIVQQFGGSVSLRSDLDRGTSVTVLVPLAEESIKNRDSELSIDPIPGGVETILIVEDEDTVMQVVLGLLERQGYRLLTAQNGIEALEIYQRVDGEVDLVLADVVMPKMGGIELIESLERRGKSPKVLFMSACSEHAASEMEKLADYGGLIGKPFSASDLASRVRCVLDGIG